MKGIWAIHDRMLARSLSDYMGGIIKQDHSPFRIDSKTLFFHGGDEECPRISSQACFLVTDQVEFLLGYKEKRVFGAFIKTQHDQKPNPQVFWAHFSLVELPIKYDSFFVKLGVCLKAYKAFQVGPGDYNKIGTYDFVPQERCFTHRVTGDKIMMTEKESELLAVLSAREGEVVSKKELLKEVWAYEDQVTTRTLESHIYALRKKIERISAESYLFTETGGYRLGKP